MPKVFVYGTLRKNERNHHYLVNAKRLAEQAWTYGELHETSFDFPVLLRNEHKKVYGELYELSDEQLMNIDRLEGYHEDETNQLYDRQLVRIYTDLDEHDAYVYVKGRAFHSEMKEIPLGDWKVFRMNDAKRKTVYYFAYGSCMDHERFQKHEVDHYFQRVIGRGVLHQYSLKFSLPTSDGGKADIIEDKQSHVEGIVYEIPFEAVHYLYKREGVSIGLYRPTVIDLYVQNQLHKDVLTFVVIHKQDETPPSCQYAKEIFRGGKDYLSEDYLKQLQKHVKMLNSTLRDRKSDSFE